MYVCSLCSTFVLFMFRLLVTSILEVSKEDPERPRVMQARLDSKTGLKDGYLEFDTIESAREWRRELQGCSCLS